MNTPIALLEHLRPIADILANPEVTEVCINRPGEVFFETDSGWVRDERSELSYVWAQTLGAAIASFNSRPFGDEDPILDGQLPEGERVHLVHPPNCEPGTVSITIRRPPTREFTHDELVSKGIYTEATATSGGISQTEEQLLHLYERRLFDEFMPLAVRSRRTVMVCGPTGSGKTRYTNSLCQYIDQRERILTIEDVQETRITHVANRVHLLYKRDGAVTAKQLLQGALRMRPDRILLAEIRGPEAYDYLVNVSTGHPGSITTIHSESIASAFEMLVLRMKESEEGRSLDRRDILNMLYRCVDVICQLGVTFDTGGKKQRRITEIYYDPKRKHTLPGANSGVS
jgi:type IV secretion system protein VirB11